MREAPPAVKEWNELFAVAAELRHQAPWKWMYDSDVFGVRNPANGEIGYCCVLGHLREVLGVIVYLGAEGLATQQAMQTGGFDLRQPDLLLEQRCLVLTYDRKDSLDEADLELIRRLGLKFRGPRVIPQFRSFRPGFLPWRLDAGETRFLTLILRQVIEMAKRLKKEPSALDSPREGSYLVRSTVDGQWAETWQEPEPQEEDLPVEPIDELRVQRIKNAQFRRKGVWEIDSFYVPAAVSEVRPYYPYLFVIVSPRHAKPIHMALGSPEDHVTRFQDAFLAALEKGRVLPTEVQVERAGIERLLEPIAGRLSIPIERVDVLRTASFLRASLHSVLMKKLEDV